MTRSTAPSSGPNTPYAPYARYAHEAYAAEAGVVPRAGADTELARAYTVLWLRPGAPLAVVKAAYRALAAAYHPDAGGDARVMARLNQAYESITRHLTR